MRDSVGQIESCAVEDAASYLIGPVLFSLMLVLFHLMSCMPPLISIFEKTSCLYHILLEGN
jgi:hypothetical protein